MTVGVLLGACVSAGPPPTLTGVAMTKYPVRTYRVRGNTGPEVNRSLFRGGANIIGTPGALAVAKIGFEFEGEPVQRRSVCLVENADVTVDAEVTVPVWRSTRRASPELRAAWKDFEGYARWHEEQHILIAERFAARVEAAIESARARTCDSLTVQVNRVVRRIGRQHDAAQRQFDVNERRRVRRLLNAIDQAA
ncbi:MAG: DUF922 domain-containing protein [Pseudomonadota bacterium]